MTTELLAWLINATVATSLVGVAILVLRKPLQRFLGAEIAYRLWIALPLATLAAGFSLPHAATIGSTRAQATMASTPEVIVRVTSSLRSVDADRWVLAIWLLGACALFTVLVWQQRRFVMRLRLRERDDGSWRSGVENATPAVLGVLRQKLVLPECFETDYSDTEQRLVIAHERMHQRRRDPWALAACALLRTVFWFNPIVHVAATRFRRDVELACDAAVLRDHPRSRRRYADALLKSHFAGQPAPVGCHWHNTPPMKERIMLLNYALPARRARLAGAILVGIATLASAGLALAGHDSALGTASALAAASAPTSRAPMYKVKLAMSVDGKPVASPAVITRAGETAEVKVDQNGVAWGFRFHVDPMGRPRGVAVTGDVFTTSEQHVIGHSHHEETSGVPMLITMQDKAGGPRYRIELQVAPAPPMSPHADRQMRAESYASAPVAPGEQREIRIVRDGTPRPEADLDSDDNGDESEQVSESPGDTSAPQARREMRRVVSMRAPSDDVGNDRTQGDRVVRKVIVESQGDGGGDDIAPAPPMPPMAPLPPLPPHSSSRNAMAPMAPLPPLPPMRAPRPPAPPMAPPAMAPPPPPPMHAPRDLPAPPAPPMPPAPPESDDSN